MQLLVTERLRDGAEALREVLPPKPPRVLPPIDPGEVLADVARNPHESVRVSWHTLDGNGFAQVRLWALAEDGTIRPTRKGIAIRIAELATIAEGVAVALERAREHVVAKRKRAGKS